MSTQAELDEQAFTLVYYVNGLTLADIDRMSHRRRQWWLVRLDKQLKMEADENRKAARW